MDHDQQGQRSECLSGPGCRGPGCDERCWRYSRNLLSPCPIAVCAAAHRGTPPDCRDNRGRPRTTAANFRAPPPTTIMDLPARTGEPGEDHRTVVRVTEVSKSSISEGAAHRCSALPTRGPVTSRSDRSGHEWPAQPGFLSVTNDASARWAPGSHDAVRVRPSRHFRAGDHVRRSVSGYPQASTARRSRSSPRVKACRLVLPAGRR